MQFKTYPFEKLNNLLLHVKPNEQYSSIALTIGEPQFKTPAFILKCLNQHAHLLNKYPKTKGEDFLINSQLQFVKKRFDVTLKQSELLPTFGTREVLFNFPQFLLSSKKNPQIAYVNPFYQIYEGAAIASRAKIHLLNLDEKNNFKPNINDEILKKCDFVILNSPNNPTGSCMSLDELSLWVEKALKYDFILLNDECYSELYIKHKPSSLLQASLHVNNDKFKNILVVNSISKRSSAPGLRSGFIAGDENILKHYLTYRTYVGCASPLPLQHAAAVAWSDELHVEKIRKKYAQNFAHAKNILNITPYPYTFYVWLKVQNDEEFTKKLYEQKNVKVLPGSYLGREKMGKEFVRLALVYEPKIIKDALMRIKGMI